MKNNVYKLHLSKKSAVSILSFFLSFLLLMVSQKSMASGYASSSVNQVTGNVAPGSLSQQIVVVAVNGNSNGFLSNWQIASCSFTMSNTSNANVTAAKLWINSSNTFSGATQTGSTVNNPTGTINFTINTGNIGNNNRFLFLTFDISASSPCSGNVVDAFVPTNGLVITGNGSGNKTPSPNNPSGNRPIFNAVTPTISITSSGNNSCEGNPISFNAVITNGGPSPAYQWSINGVNAGSNQNSFSSSSLSTGNQVACILTSTANCATPVSIASNTIVVSIFANPKPKVIPADTILCTGSVVILITKDTGSFSGGYPAGTTFDYGFSPSTDSTLLVNGNGNYSVIVTLPLSFGSCQATSSAPSISFIDAPYVTLVSDSVSCFGETNSNIYAQVQLGTIPFHYKWYNNGLLVRDTISSQTFDTLKNTGAGAYCLVVSDSIAGSQSGLVCASDSLCIEVTGPALLHATHIKSNVNCLSGNDGSINLNVTGGSVPYTYLWSNAQTDEDISQLSAGAYTVTVTDQHGCFIQHIVNILTTPDNTAPTLNCPVNIYTTPADSSSCDALVTYVTPVGSDNCPWVHTVQTAGLPSGSFFPLGETTNTFVATDTSGNSTTCTFYVTVSESIFPIITCSSNIVLNNDSGSCSAVVIYPAVIASDNCSIGLVTQTDGLPSGSNFPIGKTTNTFSVTDGSGNTSTCSFDVTVEDNTLPVISCHADTTLLNSPGLNGAFFNYSVTFGDNCSSTLIQTNGLASGAFFPVGTTINTFIVTDPSGNSDSCSFSVTVNDNEPPVVLCQNISVILDSNGTVIIDPLMVDGGSQDNSGILSRTVLPNTFSCSEVGPNAVQLTITDIHGNSASCFATITVSSDISTSISPDPVQLCSGNSLLLSGNPTGGSGVYANHHWSGDNSGVADTTVETSLFNGTLTGTFNLTYEITDNHGCKASDAVVINVFSPISITVTKTDINCFGGNDGNIQVFVSGGSGNVNYLWSSGETTSSVFGKVAGTYDVTVSDLIGCTVTQSNTLSEPTNIVLTTSSTHSGCGGIADGTATVSVSGGVSEYNYLWSNGQTTATATGLAAANYTITVTDTHSCIKTESIAVTPLTINLSLISPTYNGGYNLSCQGGNNGSIDLTVLSGFGPFTYLWSNGGTTEDISTIASGAYTVTVSNGFCSASGLITLTEPPALVLSTTSANVSCFGSANGSGSVSVTGGIGSPTYLWNTIPAKTTSTISNLNPGNYTVVVSDANGCQQNTGIIITQPTAISMSAVITNLKCKGDNSGAINITVNGGTQPYSYLWNTGVTAEDRTGLKAKSYTVTVTDANGCTKKSTFNVTEPNSTLQILTNKTTVRCFAGNTGTASVTASGGVPPYSYSWNTIPVKTTSSISSLYAGIYTCTITDAGGCVKTAVFDITQPTLLILTTSHSNVTTNGGNDGTASVSASGGTPGYSYLWYTFPIKTTASLINLTAGTYFVRVTDTKGCSKTALIIITQPSAKNSFLPSGSTSSVSVFPNPSKGKTTVSMENMKEKEIYMRLYDIIGNLVYKDNISLVSKLKNTKDYDFGLLPKGVYLMRLNNKNYSRTMKVVLE